MTGPVEILARGRQPGQAATMHCLAKQDSGCLHEQQTALAAGAPRRAQSAVLGRLPHHFPRHVMGYGTTGRRARLLSRRVVPPHTGTADRADYGVTCRHAGVPVRMSCDRPVAAVDGGQRPVGVGSVRVGRSSK